MCICRNVVWYCAVCLTIIMQVYVYVEKPSCANKVNINKLEKIIYMYVYIHVHVFTKGILKLTFLVRCLHNVFPHNKSLLKHWSTAWQYSLIDNTETADTLLLTYTVYMYTTIYNILYIILGITWVAANLCVQVKYSVLHVYTRYVLGKSVRPAQMFQGLWHGTLSPPPHPPNVQWNLNDQPDTCMTRTWHTHVHCVLKTLCM